MREGSRRYVQQFASELFLRRTGAFLIDMAACFGCLYGLEQLLGSEAFSSEKSELTKNILYSLFLFVPQWAFRGKSLGKWIARIRVVTVDGQRAGFFPLLTREFAGRFLVEKSNLIIAYLLKHYGVLDRLREQIQNPIADTLVVAAIVLPWLTFVSFAFVLCRPDGRAIHDLISGTRVERDL